MVFKNFNRNATKTKMFVMVMIFISFSISVSLTGLMKNEFNLDLFFRYFQVFCFWLELTLNVSAIEVLFVIIFLFTNKEFEDILALDFSVKNHFVPFSIFLRFIFNIIFIDNIFQSILLFQLLCFKFVCSCCAWLTQLQGLFPGNKT